MVVKESDKAFSYCCILGTADPDSVEPGREAVDDMTASLFTRLEY